MFFLKFIIYLASEAVDWMLTHLGCRTREEAISIGTKLVDEGFIEHVVEPQPFKDTYLFFVFTVIHLLLFT